MTARVQARAGGGLGFGLFYFGVHEGNERTAYRRFLQTTRLADRLGLEFISIPERHFHRFGGAFPNPALIAAAAATVTQRIQIRAGSVVGPLTDTLRLAEDWALLDDLSGGRVAVSLGSGWSVNDFVLAREPAQAFRRRREIVVEQIAELRHLWAGGRVARQNAAGESISLATFPRPVSGAVPLWLTAGGSEQTFCTAGRLGVNVLTHLERQDLAALARRIALYRAARERHGHDPSEGIVTLMQHTLIGAHARVARRQGREHLERYIRAALDLESVSIAGGGRSSGGAPVVPLDRETVDRDAMVAAAVTRYLDQASLIGALEDCRERAFGYLAAGVNEIACLIDFVDDHELVSDTIHRIGELRTGMAAGSMRAQTTQLVSRFNSVGEG